MVPEEVLNLVDPRWRDAFEHMLDTGEAEPEFLEYLDRHPAGNRILDVAFELQSDRIRAFAEGLRQLGERERMPERDEPVLRLVRQLTEAFRALSAERSVNRAHIVEMALSDLEPDLQPSVFEAFDAFRRYSSGHEGVA